MSNIINIIIDIIIGSFFFNQYLKYRKKYKFLIVIYEFISILLNVSFVNIMPKVFETIFKFISLILAVIFLYQFIKDIKNKN